MKNSFHKRDIAIDLTSLLDVIFIVLLIVMCNQKFETKEAVQQADQMMQQAQEMMQEQQSEADFQAAWNQHFEQYENVDEIMLFINVRASYEKYNIQNRTILVLTGIGNGTQEPWKAEFNQTGASAAYQQLKEHLKKVTEEYIGSQEGVTRPVIIALNREDEDILYRDEVAIDEILKELAAGNEMIYLR